MAEAEFSFNIGRENSNEKGLAKTRAKCHQKAESQDAVIGEGEPNIIGLGGGLHIRFV